MSPKPKGKKNKGTLYPKKEEKIVISFPHVVVKGGARLEKTPRPPGTAGWWRVRRESITVRRRL